MASVAAGSLLNLPGVADAQDAPATPNKLPPLIGIQAGAVSFVDEGVDAVLDVFQKQGQVNTIFLATFTYGRGIAGRQVPGQPLPDHGKQEYDEQAFRGGNYARPHPQFYEKTVLKSTKVARPWRSRYPRIGPAQGARARPESVLLVRRCFRCASSQHRAAAGNRPGWSPRQHALPVESRLSKFSRLD